MESNQKESKPKLCVNNCGFFGNPLTNDMCSKCYKSTQSTQNLVNPQIIPTRAETQTVAPKVQVTTQKSLEKLETKTTPVDEASESPKPISQKDTSRCFSCNKRVGLTGIKCRCEYVFCGKHRYAEAHECSYDYKSDNIDVLRKQNPVVAAAKIQKF